MPKKTPVINIKPADIEVMNPDDFEAPELFIVVDEPTGQKFCAHEQIRIFPHHRLIHCRDCQAVLDPFDYMLKAGRLSHNFLSHMKYLKIQMDRMVKEEEQLRKLYNSLKKKR
jgi:hypothetical protein